MLVIAHRGFSARFPENTLQAFEQAFRAGADMVEMDVRLAADGVPVVAHDADLSRLYRSKKRVAALSAQEIKKLSKNAIPTLQEVLHAFAGKGQFYVEVKAERMAENRRLCLVEAVRKTVKESPAAKDCLIASFDFRVARQIRSEQPRAWTGVITDKHAAVNAHLRRGLGFADACCPHNNLLSASLIASLRALKKQIFPWVLDGAQERQKAMALGVDGIVTNDPESLRGEIAR